MYRNCRILNNFNGIKLLLYKFIGEYSDEDSDVVTWKFGTSGKIFLVFIMYFLVLFDCFIYLIKI